MGRAKDFRKYAHSRFPKSSRPVRSTDQREQRKRYLIISEGEKTERNYFESLKKKLPRHLVELNPIGTGANTLSLIKIAEDELSNASIKYDQCWLVFDKDDFPDDRFDNTINSARQKKIECAWSNEAFELWYLLHFEYRNTAMSRKDYKTAISRYLGIKYQKNATDMYARLEKFQDDAIDNAEKLLRLHKGKTPSKSNPATTVHKLIKELKKYLT